jgi:Rad3-related DNA helicase
MNTIAHEINLIKEQTNKFLLHSSIEIGKRLSEAKEMAGHGNWYDWLESEVNYSRRTAQNLIKIYEEYGLKQLENSKTQALADLGYTQAVAMLRLDFEERENFVLEHEIEDMTTRELEEAIKEKNELLKEKNELQKLLDEQTDKESDLAVELQKRVDEISDFESKIKDAATERNELKAEIERLQAIADEAGANEEIQLVDPEEVETLKEYMARKDAEILELKAELKKKPKEVEIEVEVEKEVEVIPAEIEQELENLRSKLQVSDGAVKFKATFEIIVNLFNELVEVVEDMQENSPDEYVKYKGAVNKMLDRLAMD